MEVKERRILDQTHTHTTLVVMVIVFNWSAVLLRSLQCVQELLDLVRHSALTTMSGCHRHLRHLDKHRLQGYEDREERGK